MRLRRFESRVRGGPPGRQICPLWVWLLISTSNQRHCGKFVTKYLAKYACLTRGRGIGIAAEHRGRPCNRISSERRSRRGENGVNRTTTPQCTDGNRSQWRWTTRRLSEPQRLYLTSYLPPVAALTGRIAMRRPKEALDSRPLR